MTPPVEPADADDPFGEDPFDEVDPERLHECAYWRCGELFEARSATHVFCRRACRSRQRKWERAQARRARRSGRPAG